MQLLKDIYIFRIVHLTLLLFLVFPSIAQRNEVDSLESELKKSRNADEKITLNITIGNQYLNSHPEKSRKYALAGIALSKKSDRKKYLSELWGTIGSSYFYEANWEKSRWAYKKALDLARRHNGKEDVARAYNNLGLVNLKLSNFIEAQKNFHKSLSMREELKDIIGEVAVLNNLSALHTNMDNLEKAEFYCQRAYKKALQTKNQGRIANSITNLGVLYYDQNKKQKALDHFYEAAAIYESIGDNWSLATVYSNTGVILTELKNYSKALVDLNRSLKIKREIGDNGGVALAYFNMGSLCSETGRSKEALQYYNEAEKIYLRNKDVEDLKALYKTYALTYSELKDYKSAYQYFLKYDAIRDTLLGKDQTRAVEEMETRYETEKKEKELLINQRDLRLKNQILKAKQAELDGEKYFKNSMIGLAAFVILVAGLLYYGYNNKRKANHIISLQKVEVERQRDEVHKQKIVVEHKNKEILDSINYAKRIQYALLANEQLLGQHVPDHVVYFKPKDIVSGDFYWTTFKDDSFYLAACDSTGHGVPGAFMSLLNTSFLNEALNDMDIRQTGPVFDHVRTRLVQSISHEGAQDGMDGILLKLNSVHLTNGSGRAKIEYSAANNAPVLVRGNEVVMLPFDKMPVGKSDKTTPFNSHSVDLQKGDTLFIYTDGFADQFGGPKGKKFKYTNLNRLLMELSQKHARNPLMAIYEELDRAFNDWKGDLEQVDDVCVIGMRI